MTVGGLFNQRWIAVNVFTISLGTELVSCTGSANSCEGDSCIFYGVIEQLPAGYDALLFF